MDISGTSGKRATIAVGSPRSWSFLARLSEQDREALHRVAVLREMPRGARIFGAGDVPTHVYLLKSGRAKVFHLSDAGKEVLLWFCFPGEIFGLAEVCQDSPRQASAEVCERSQLLSVSREDFNEFVQLRPAVMQVVVDLLSARLRELGTIVQEMVGNDVTHRLITLIRRLMLRYGRLQGEEYCLDLGITHQEIADMIGTTRQTVTTTLGELRRTGALAYRNRKIYLARERLGTGMGMPTDLVGGRLVGL